MKHITGIPRLSTMGLIALSTLLATACDSGGGDGSAAGFLGIEARVDRDGPGASNGNEPQIVAVGSAIYTCWEDDRTGTRRVYFNTSTDGGKTWLPNDVHVPGTATGQDIEHPYIACDGATVFVAFEEEQGTGSEDLYINRSTDGGLTWQAQGTRLDTGPAGAADSERPAIVVQGTMVMVAWHDEVNGLADDIFFSRSMDDGISWSTPVRLDTDAPGGSTSEYVALCADGNDVYVAWEDDRNGLDDLYFNYSSDGGVTWLASDVRIDGDMAGGATSRYHQIGCNGKEVYASWQDDRAGNEDIYFRRSTDGGATWGPEVVLGSSPGGIDDSDHSMTNAGQRVVLGWKARNPGSKEDQFVSVSADGGATWLPAPIRLDTDAAGAGDSDDIDLCIDGTNVFATWEDDRNGLDDIYLSYSTDGGLTWTDPDLFAEGGPKGTSDATDPSIACSSEGVWMIWQDDRNGNIDIFVNGGQLP